MLQAICTGTGLIQRGPGGTTVALTGTLGDHLRSFYAKALFDGGRKRLVSVCSEQGSCAVGLRVGATVPQNASRSGSAKPLSSPGLVQH